MLFVLLFSRNIAVKRAHFLPACRGPYTGFRRVPYTAAAAKTARADAFPVSRSRAAAGGAALAVLAAFPPPANTRFFARRPPRVFGLKFNPRRQQDSPRPAAAAKTRPQGFFVSFPPVAGQAAQIPCFVLRAMPAAGRGGTSRDAPPPNAAFRLNRFQSFTTPVP